MTNPYQSPATVDEQRRFSLADLSMRFGVPAVCLIVAVTNSYVAYMQHYCEEYLAASTSIFMSAHCLGCFFYTTKLFRS